MAMLKAKYIQEHQEYIQEHARLPAEDSHFVKSRLCRYLGIEEQYYMDPFKYIKNEIINLRSLDQVAVYCEVLKYFNLNASLNKLVIIYLQ